jgi:hypothetical protein
MQNSTQKSIFLIVSVIVFLTKEKHFFMKQYNSNTILSWNYADCKLKNELTQSQNQTLK